MSDSGSRIQVDTSALIGAAGTVGQLAASVAAIAGGDAGPRSGWSWRGAVAGVAFAAQELATASSGAAASRLATATAQLVDEVVASLGAFEQALVRAAQGYGVVEERATAAMSPWSAP